MVFSAESPIRTIALSAILLLVICLMILPIPAWLLDAGVAASFSLAILMLITTLFIQRPLDFSVFPTVLIGSLVLRLSLNVASTKLIIDQGHAGTDAAGEIIEGFAMFIMSGNIVIGLVVFCVLLIVNLLVINKGATRMAEVGARFALDAMPGKQLAIDSDIASGAITHEVGKERRALEQAETTFFGSLDGTSKFVKGDAVAGLIITVLNLLVGLSVGVMSHGMAPTDAFTTYSILTVGDGLVSQIPAVLISLATAILLARGGAHGTTDVAVSTQFGKHPIALMVVGVLLMIFAIMPGLPAAPFLALSLIVGGIGFYGYRHRKSEDEPVDTVLDEVPSPAASESLPNLLEVEEIQIEFSTDLISLVLDPSSGLENRIANIRRHIGTSYGVLLPEIHLTDNYELTGSKYVIRLMDTRVGQFNIEPERKLVINPPLEVSEMDGTDVSEPVYGAPAKWLSAEDAEIATLSGNTVVDPAEVIATHLLDSIKKNLERIFTFSAMQDRLANMSNLEDVSRSAANKKLIDALIPEKVSLELLHSVLRSLLSEGVSIRNLQLILEAISSAKQFSPSFESIYMMVRSRLAPQIVDALIDPQGNLNILQLSNEWEVIFSQYTLKKDHNDRVGLPDSVMSEFTAKLSQKISETAKNTEAFVIGCVDHRRSFLREIIVANSLDVPVLSFSELSHARSINVVRVIDV